MRNVTCPSRAAVLLGAALLAAICGPGRAAMADATNGWDIYGRGVRQVTCGTRPVLLTGNHTDVSLRGPCRYVRVAGEHNDVHLAIAPGGTIEITGAHNDVFWHPLGDPAIRPVLLDKGSSNTFHHRLSGEAADQ